VLAYKARWYNWTYKPKTSWALLPFVSSNIFFPNILLAGFTLFEKNILIDMFTESIGIKKYIN